MDIMHLSVLNDPNLLLKLFLGKLDVYDPDNREKWDWAIFYQKPALWNAHGKMSQELCHFYHCHLVVHLRIQL